MTAERLRTDPDEPLPGVPDPWAESDMPPRRDGPPWHMTEMIEAEPALAVRILERLAADGSAARLAGAVAKAFDAGRPIVIVGCGTSEHGAQAVAAQLRAGLAMRRFTPPDDDVLEDIGLDPMDTALYPTVGPGDAGSPTAVQAFEASLVPTLARGGLVIGVSHEGGTWATIQALEAADRWGAELALVTAAAGSPAAQRAHIVLDTVELDQSWCHTVGYVSPIVAGLAVTMELSVEGALGVAERAEDGAALAGEVRSLLADGLSPAAVGATETIARRLAEVDRIVVIASGVDRIAGRELALKIEEGVHLPSTLRDTETVLHGHLAGMDERTGVVAIAADDEEEESRGRRLTQALRAIRELGIPAGAIFGRGLLGTYGDLVDPGLTPAGRVVVDRRTTLLAGPGRSLLATAVPLQLLTERLARARGVNPDPIRRDDPRYLRAAEAASPHG